MLYRLTPTLINEGYVYIAESPLYEINTKDHTYFAYTEPEKATFLEEIGDKKYTIQRSKGLGENDPEMMWLSFFCKKVYEVSLIYGIIREDTGSGGTDNGQYR